jgi:pimeloyl-ACP methyl ester carboxylesterase
MIQTENITFKDSTIALHTNKSEGKTPIVFIHGNSMSSKIWKKQFESTLSETYYLIAMDIPGHGESGDLGSYDLRVLAESISVVINAKKLQDYVLVGNSLGGDIILQELGKLQNCKGIVLIDTPPVSKPPKMELSFLPNPIVGMFFAKDYDKANLDALSQALFSDINNIPDFIKSDFERTDGMMRQSLAETVGSGNYTDEVEILKNAKIPVAIFAGKNEKMVNNNYFLSLDVPKLWQNKTFLIQDAAHCPQWENAAEFNELLEQFVRFSGNN